MTEDYDVGCIHDVVVKTNAERVRSNDLEGPDSINRMTHNHLFQGLDGC